MTVHHPPQERWIVLYWDDYADRPDQAALSAGWRLGVAQPVSEPEARELADRYRHELGRQRVRVLHTADGT